MIGIFLESHLYFGKWNCKLRNGGKTENEDYYPIRKVRRCIIMNSTSNENNNYNIGQTLDSLDVSQKM
jgi:hypothetical protein